KFGVLLRIIDNGGNPGEFKTATSSVFSERTKHSDAIALVRPTLGKPSIMVPPLRLIFFILRISIGVYEDNIKKMIVVLY
ncbi:MAG TPA: hypothetical protein VFD60_04330, partial [Nitrososphaeraceae archaeon]|nr:hypothetical protein [Nitrososphaeraceae archaeon]